MCLVVAGTVGLRAEWQPGLKVGTVSGQANWTDWPAVTNTTLRLDATEKVENNTYVFWVKNNTTYVYWGQMYFQEGVYHFAESMDDSAWVEIDGKAVGEQTATVTDLTAETTYFFRIYATNARGEAWSAAKSFTSWGVPVLASADCTGVARTVAGFAWELGAGDFAWCGVELREKNGTAIETAAWKLVPAGERQTQAVGNLTPGAAYEWNVVASNGQGVVRSEVKEFTTPTQVVSRRSVRSGSWGDAATWDPAGVPFIGDIVTVSAGTVVTNAAATESLASLTVEEGGELFVDGWDSAIRAIGAVTVAGRLVHATNEVLTANAADFSAGCGGGQEGEGCAHVPAFGRGGRHGDVAVDSPHGRADVPHPLTVRPGQRDVSDRDCHGIKGQPDSLQPVLSRADAGEGACRKNRSLQTDVAKAGVQAGMRCCINKTPPSKKA